ncbi:MAG: glycosyltransferase family 2 protein [Deltaproteobacteria bacterium]|nr:glycosyltransferase family 2 protein [Deltaproteobacteria bacterium]
MHIEITIVVLCYRTGKRINSYVSKIKNILDANIFVWELVLVGNYDDGASDETPALVNELAANDPRIRAVTLPKKGMMGWDARTGMDMARGKYLCIVDGDEQIPAEDIIRVYQKIRTDNLDFVLPYREKRHDGFIRILNSKIYNIFAKILFPCIKVKDINAKPKIFTKMAYEKLNLTSDDWFIDAEIVIKSSKLGLKIGQVPTEFKENEYRRSFVTLDTVMEFIKNLIMVRLKEYRKW